MFMKSLRSFLITLFLIICSTALSAGQEKISTDTIRTLFREIKATTNKYKDLWNIDLYGPILLADQGTRTLFSNFPDSAGILKQNGEIFSGIMPGNMNIANTAITWSGRSWAMIMLPLPANKSERLDLLSHELFHRSQAALGFKMNNPANNHLDQKEGRIYLRLELEALRQALISGSTAETSLHLAYALYFRNHRYSIYPDARPGENSLELNEGLAEYTGIFMSGRDNKQTEHYFENKISGFQNYPTFVRSFAYLTTPLYGFLLSKYDKYWNRQVDNNTNLTDFFINAFRINIPDNPEKETLNQYGFSEIVAEETKREEKTKQLISELKKIFIESPHLEIRFEKMNISFDPRNIIPLEGYGTVYPSLKVIDNWGILTVSDGALLGTSWDKITLSEPTQIEKDKVTGNGWTIDLKSGYIVKKNSSDNNYSLQKK